MIKHNEMVVHFRGGNSFTLPKRVYTRRKESATSLKREFFPLRIESGVKESKQEAM